MVNLQMIIDRLQKENSAAEMITGVERQTVEKGMMIISKEYL